MLVRYPGDREQGLMPRQLVFVTTVGPGEMMTTASRDKPAKVTQVTSERDSGMLGTGTATTDIVQEMQNEMGLGRNMGIEAGSQRMASTGSRGGGGGDRDHDHGRWTEEMAEMRSDVEWVDTHLRMLHPNISWLPLLYPSALFGLMLINPGPDPSAGVLAVVYSLVWHRRCRTVVWANVGAC
jgi:hypothetical protein